MLINGSNFQSGCTITFHDPQGNPYVRTPTFNSSSQLSHPFNDNSDSGTWTVFVTNPDNQTSNTWNFQVTAMISAPTVTTTTPSSITTTTASSGGNVTSDGGASVTARGVCWSTLANPTTGNNHTSDGTGTGSFTSSLTGLSPSTQYHVRAYATNSAGTGYGSDLTFTTGTPTGVVDYPGAVWVAGVPSGNYAAASRIASDIRWIVIHTTESSADFAIQWFQNSASGVSAHYLVRRDGSIVQLVRDRDIAYHAGNWAYNQRAIGIEHERYTGAEVTTAQYAASSQLTQWLCAQYAADVVFPAGIAPADPAASLGIIGHNQVPDPSNPSLGGGADHHTDPTNWDWNYYKSLLGVVTTPTVTTTIPSSITTTTATSGGNVTSNGGAAVTACGVCWSTSANPTTGNSHTSDGTGTGTFTSYLTGLAPSTLYHVRAYATNGAGTGYGSDLSFTTAAPTNLPNLVPYQPSGWSDRIVVSNVTGTHTDGSPLYTTDNLYVDWAIRNNGSATINTMFYVALYIDGSYWYSWPPTIPMGSGDWYYWGDYNIGQLGAGTHTLQLVADNTGVISESNESDNSYTKTITVLPSLPNLTPYQPSGWSDKLVLSNQPGTSTDAGPLCTTDTVYVDWAVVNNETASINTTFYCELYVDGNSVTSWWAPTPLDSGAWTYVLDYSIGSLTEGTHTIEILADSTDAIGETNETDNTYMKIIAVYSRPAPPNDDFSDRIPVDPNGGMLTGTNIGATKESGESNHAGNTGGRSVWWTWTPTSSGNAQIDTIGSTFDTILGVYNGNIVSALTTWGSDDDSGGNLTSKATFNAVAGTTYQIAVDGFGGASGDITLHVIAPGHLTGDLNGDNYVNVGDLQALVAAWASQSGPPASTNWNPSADLNSDGYVNVGDLQILLVTGAGRLTDEDWRDVRSAELRNRVSTVRDT